VLFDRRAGKGSAGLVCWCRRLRLKMNSRADCRSIRRAHEVQRNAGVYDLVVSCRVRPDGAYGMGQPSECIGGRAFPDARFCGGNGRAPHLRSFSLGVRPVSGKARGYPKEQTAPHRVVLSFIGACMLWAGWFGVNAGSAFAAGSLATSAFVATQFAAAAAAWDGRERSGLAMASRAYWGESPELWRAWWQSRQRLVLCSRWLPWPSV
jgi:hypothetical protein